MTNGIRRNEGTAERIFVHLGEPKTGTTSLQHTMWVNRHRLAELGIVYPGDSESAHWRASQDVLEIEQEPGDPAPPWHGEWAQLVAAARRGGHTGIISHELLAYATAAQARRAMKFFDGVETHLVLTVRDFASMLPAEWQELTKHRDTRTFEEFLHYSIVTLDEAPDRHERVHFWKSHSCLDVLAEWAGDVVPPEHIHVITLPPPGAPRELLWQRFASVVGIDPSEITLDEGAANPSLGIVESELLRRLNVELPKSFPEWTYQWYVKGLLAHEAYPRRTMSARIQLPSKYAAFALDETERTVAGLQKSGYQIVGDLRELEPRPTTPPEPQPGEVPADDLLDTALYSITALLRHMEEMRVQLHEAGVAKHGPVTGLLIALSERNLVLHRARVGYWRMANRLRNKVNTS